MTQPAIPTRAPMDEARGSIFKLLGFDPVVRLGKVAGRWLFDEDYVARVLAIVDHGLTNGKGSPRPGELCVEAAVALASNEAHTDHPACVSHDLASIKIGLNDAEGWTDRTARAKGLRRLAVAQLGSSGVFNTVAFRDFMTNWMLGVIHARVLEDMKTINRNNGSYSTLQQIDAIHVRWKGYYQRANDAYNAQYCRDMLRQLQPKNADGTYRTNNDVLNVIAEAMVQACIAQDLPGTKFLYLTEGDGSRRAVTAKLKAVNPEAAKVAARQRKASLAAARRSKAAKAKRVAKHK